MPQRKLSPFHRFRKVEVQKPPAANKTASEDLWPTALRATAEGDLTTAIRAHDAMSRQDYIWHLSIANDIFEATDPSDTVGIVEAKRRIIDDATNLAVSRLHVERLVGLQLEPHHFDDAGIEHPPELRDLMLFGRSWDNTDRNPLIAEFFVRTVETLGSTAANELADSFYNAYKDETLTFHQACLNRFAKYNDFNLRQADQMVAPRAEIAPATNIPTVDEVIEGAKLVAR